MNAQLSAQQQSIEPESVLESLSEHLDVPTSKYEEAKKHYQAVGEWLNQEDTDIAKYTPSIYWQGSFALGTAVKPVGNEEYDVDAVCLLQCNPEQYTQQQIKELVGNRLKENATYKEMLDKEGRRCWTLNYAEDSKFHLDILPAVPDPLWPLLILDNIPEHLAKTAICITDRTMWFEDEWPKSNPKGYLEWFKGQMAASFEKSRLQLQLAKTIRGEVQEIPEYEIRTPLQRTVQLLKRHRDLMFEGDPNKPISIIITTLTALAYKNESDLCTTLSNTIALMPSFIERRNGEYWIQNPVNPEENFAHRWNENPEKAEAFFQWLNAIERVAENLHVLRTPEEFENYLRPNFGNREVSSAIRKVLTNSPVLKSGFITPPRKDLVHRIVDSVLCVSRGLLSGQNIPWKLPPQWTVRELGHVSIRASYGRPGGRQQPFGSDSNPLPKNCSLVFHANTTIQPPYNVWWQVTNSGEEAKQVAGGLRGEFVEGELRHTENTEYRGSHSIECFIVKDDVCVARSGPFVVNIM